MPNEKNQDMEPPYMTVNNVCRYLKDTNESLYSWIQYTNIPAHRLGKLWLFDMAELDARVKSGKAAE